MLTCSMMRFLSLLLLGLCGVSPWSVCEVVVVPYVVSVVVVVTDACTVVSVACVCAVRVMAMLVWGPGEVWLR